MDNKNENKNLTLFLFSICIITRLSITAFSYYIDENNLPYLGFIFLVISVTLFLLYIGVLNRDTGPETFG